ncbi:hypothetical protein BJF79_22550 [Actinomadura sp. CNU-125]|nr:hypothetical protein BJF79_22550 [Actinomadura sp. CNU-125]
MLATALLLSACGDGGGDAPDGPDGRNGRAASSPASTAATLTAPNTTRVPVTTPADRGLDRAAATALEAVPGTVLTSIETEGEGWEVELVTADGTEREVLVDGSGTEVLRNDAKQEDRDDRDENLARIRHAKLGYRDAADTMRAAVPGARITELNLDTYRGTVVWEGDVTGPDGAPHSLEVDAATGHVLRR